MYVRKYVYMYYVCMCVCTYVDACMYVCMYVCIFVCMYVFALEGSVLFNDALNIFYLQLYGVGYLRWIP